MTGWIEDFFVTDEQLEAYDVWRREGPLRMWRIENGMTIPQAAKRLRRKEKVYTSYEWDHRRISDKTAVSFQKIMGDKTFKERLRIWEANCPIKNRPQSGV